ncbi:MAG: hypothetical protein AAFQ63_00890 [Cyanobacteria bacterium J06621_11]
MASSATQPISQRYTAGCCRLDVSFVPSALSQWSERLIVGELTFHLWMVASEDVKDSDSEVSDSDTAVVSAVSGSFENEQATLLAEGDRTQLREIAQYFQARTRSVLALSTLNAPPSHAPEPIQPPSGLQLTQPLGYLQLCDVTTVLTQYAQAAMLLPAMTSSETLHQRSTEQTSSDETSTAQTSNDDIADVIPLDTVRRASDARPRSGLLNDTAATRARRNVTRRKSGARRQRGMWASSAAAALFVAGLTTTLISRDPTLQDVSITSESASETQQEVVRSGEGDIDDVAASDRAAIEAERERAPNADPSDRIPSDAEGETTGRTPSALPDSASGQRSFPPADTEALPPRSTVGRAPTVPAERTEADRDLQEALPQEPGSQESLPQGADVSESVQPAQVPVVEDEASDSDQAFSLPTGSQSPPAGASAGASRRGAVDGPVVFGDSSSDSDNSLESRSESSPERSVTARSAPPAEATEEATEPTADSLDDSLATDAPPEALSLPSPASPPMPEAAAAPASEPSELSLDVGVQIQSYFQQRSQLSDTRPLTYRLQLSETGEVASFVGLDEVSQAERDRLLPADNSPTFSVGNAVTPRAFRIVFSQNGVVEVSPL